MSIRSLLVMSCCLLAVLPQVADGKDRKSRSAPDNGTFDAKGTYVLSEQELKLDCKRLNGRILVRLMQLRAELADTSRPSGASQTLQTVTNPALKLMYGGASSYGTDRAGQLQQDRAVLEGYNRQLAAKSCPTYDIDAELKKGPGAPGPTPPQKAPKAAQTR